MASSRTGLNRVTAMLQPKSRPEQSVSGSVSAPVCDPCDNEGTQAPAEGFCKTCGEHLCGECFRYHRKPKPMRHHVLMDSRNKPKSKSHLKQIEDSLEKCKRHADMPMKIYCRFINYFGCVVCLSDEHKSCKDVSFIQDCAKGISESREYSEFQKELKTLESSLNIKIGAARSEVEGTSKMVSSLDTQKVHSIMEMVRKVNRKVDEAKANADQILKYADTTCKDVISAIKDLRSGKQSDAVKFRNMKQCQTITSNVTKCVDKLKADIKASQDARTDLKSDAKLLKDKNMLQVFKNYVTALEKADKGNKKNRACTNLDVVSTQCFSMTVADCEYDASYYERSESEARCRITGSTVLADDSIAVVDYSNTEVNIYLTSEHVLNTKFDFDVTTKPFDIAEITEGRLAVTIPSQNEIAVLSYDYSYLEADNDATIETNGSCRGICSHKRLLYVAFDHPPKIEIINERGIVLNMIHRNLEGDLFSSPWYIAYNHVNSSVYVTDRNNGTVTRVHTRDVQTSVYAAENLERPYGITVDSSGAVYVCSRWTNRIFCLTPDFDVIKIIHNEFHLKKPESVTCLKHYDRLYVGLFEENELAVLDFQKT